MKKALFPVLLLALSAVCVSVANAGPAPGPKRPGPSAVEAARLKKNPPPNYLAHYLPDDRYKIAGGVWKYVSTDLDTYYHVPSSPNMLRQPANRVIGFANARDAEEAGYVADPTDGTATKAAPADATDPDPSFKGFSQEEVRYLKAVSEILVSYLKAGSESQRKFTESLTSMAGQSNNVRSILINLRPRTRESVAIVRTSMRRLNSLRPPARLKKFHSLRSKYFVSSMKQALIIDNAAATGDISFPEKVFEEAKASQLYNKQANDELERLRR